MVIKKVTYEKRFESQSLKDPRKNSQDEKGYKITQEINSLDKELRKDLINEFSKNERNNPFTGNKEHYGYDGKFLYKFRIESNFNGKIHSKTNENYKTQIILEKSSSEENIKNLSQPEEFLIKKRFIKNY